MPHRGGRDKKGGPEHGLPAAVGVEGHLSGQASWMASRALETGASESGDRQKEGQLPALFPSQWGVTERLRVSSVARQSCPRGGGDSARPPGVLLRCLRASLSHSVKWGQRPLPVSGGVPPPQSELPSGHAALALGPLGALGRALSLGGRGRAALPWAPPVVPVPGSKSQGFQPAAAWGRGREALKLLHQGLCLRPGVSRRLLGSADVLQGGLGMNPRHGGMRSVVLLGKEARVSDRPVTAPGIPGRSTRLPLFSGRGHGFLS